MATCTNCSNFTGNVSTGSVFSSAFPGSQFSFFYSYPTSCPGGCLYLTSSGYRCSNSTVGSCPSCNRGNGCNNCGCGTGCNCIMPF